MELHGTSGSAQEFNTETDYKFLPLLDFSSCATVEVGRGEREILLEGILWQLADRSVT